MKRRKGHIEVLARGVLVVDGQVLLCHSRGARNTYLPGGHVEFRESARAALRRELEEELGRTATVGRFLGAVEHTFRQKGARHCEINLVFEMRIRGLRPPRDPASREPKIAFRWEPLAVLARSTLEPHPLRCALARWLRAGPMPARWAGTYDDS